MELASEVLAYASRAGSDKTVPKKVAHRTAVVMEGVSEDIANAMPAMGAMTALPSRVPMIAVETGFV